MSFTLVELVAADSAAYNTFLHAGTVQHPDTLRIAPADIERTPFVIDPEAESVTLAAVDPDGRWLGVGSIDRERGREKRRHIAWIMRMYVAAPGGGVGRAILRALMTRAREMRGVSKVNLTVAAHNAGAVHLYRSEGFTPFAEEADGFFVSGRAITELTMSAAINRA